MSEVPASASKSATTNSPASTVSRTSQAEAQPPPDYDNDNDDPGDRRYDSDDGVVLYFGRPASKAIRSAITFLIRHYYASAATSDGAHACAQMYSLLAESVPEEYGPIAASSGKTCAGVMSKLYAQRHRELAAEAVSLRVTHVRVSGDRGVVLVRFAQRERRILVHREHGAWKMAVLFDVGVP